VRHVRTALGQQGDLVRICPDDVDQQHIRAEHTHAPGVFNRPKPKLPPSVLHIRPHLGKVDGDAHPPFAGRRHHLAVEVRRSAAGGPRAKPDLDPSIGRAVPATVRRQSLLERGLRVLDHARVHAACGRGVGGQIHDNLVKGGADIIELGLPFSDPVADGPTIQKSYLRALKKGISLKKIVNIVRKLRHKTDVPIVLMSSYNPVFRYGENKFVKDAVRAGIDGVIIPDLPPEETDSLLKVSDENGLDIIFLLAPTSDESRIRLICEKSRGFIYYISVTGITGERKSLSKDIGDMIKKIRRFTSLPVAVGFGVSTPAQAGEIASYADGIIVGSAIIKIIETGGRNGRNILIRKVGNFVGELKKAI